MSVGSINEINFPDTFSIKENVVNALIPKNNPNRLFGVSGFLRPFGNLTSNDIDSSSLQNNLSMFENMWLWSKNSQDYPSITEAEWYFTSTVPSFSWTSNDIYLGCFIYIFDINNNSFTNKLQEIFLGGPDINIFPDSYYNIPSLSCNDDGSILAVGISNSDKADGSVRVYNYDSNMNEYSFAFKISNPLSDVFKFGYSLSVQGNANQSENYKICIGTLNGFGSRTMEQVFNRGNRNGYAHICHIDPTTSGPYPCHYFSGAHFGITNNNAQFGWNVSVNTTGEIAVVTSGQENNEGYVIINLTTTTPSLIATVTDVNMSGVYNFSSTIFFVYHTSPWGYSERLDDNGLPVELQKVTLDDSFSTGTVTDISLDGIIKKQFNGYISGAGNNTQIIYGLLKSITFTANKLINIYYNISRVDAQFNETSENQVEKNFIAIAEFNFSDDTADLLEEIEFVSALSNPIMNTHPINNINIPSEIEIPLDEDQIESLFPTTSSTNSTLELIEEILLYTNPLEKLTSSINSAYLLLSPDTSYRLGGSFTNIVSYPLTFFFTTTNPLCEEIIILPLSDICFIENSEVKTDQGIIFIENLKPDIYSINKKPIIQITKTKSNEESLVFIKKHSLNKSMPNKDTILTQNHHIIYDDKIYKAKDLVNLNENIKLIPYKNEILYNILLEDHYIIRVNGLLCESLNPKESIVKLYELIKDKDKNEKESIIKKYNSNIIKQTKIK